MHNRIRIQYFPLIKLILVFLFLIACTDTTSAQANYRVLFAYDDFVEGVYPGLVGRASLAIAMTNQAYINSGINASVSLARVVKVKYTPANPPEIQLTHFQEAGGENSDMDEIFALRDENAADICILLTRPIGACGLVNALNVDEHGAFASMDAGCMVGMFTLGHEVGHLFGARHQLSSDPINTPFPDGHGYTGPNLSWQTIMSDRHSVTRLQYFSNPYKTNPNTGEVMGDLVSANVARVHNVRASVVANFRTLPANLVLQTQGVKFDEFSHVQASGSVTIPSGFVVESGGQLLIDVATSGLSKRGVVEPKHLLTNTKLNQPSIRTTSRGVEVKVEFGTQSKILIELFDLLGQKTKEKTFNSIQNNGFILLLPKNWFGGSGKILRIKDENGKNLLQKMVVYPDV